MNTPVQEMERVGGTDQPAMHWYAVYTYSRHEKTVRDSLEAKAIQVFLPTLSVESRWKDRNTQLSLPAFPGYVFVRIAPSQRIAVLSAPGVVRIVSFNGALAPVEDGEMEALRLCFEKGGRVEPHHFVSVGERVRVRSGALQGLEGLVIRKKGSCRLVLSIALIHQSVAVEIDAALLEASSAAESEKSKRPAVAEALPPLPIASPETRLAPGVLARPGEQTVPTFKE